MRLGNWKIRWSTTGETIELYNLRRDVAETTNVAPHYPEIIARIQTYLQTARTPARRYPRETNGPTVSDFVW
jgi:hypothetical protein